MKYEYDEIVYVKPPKLAEGVKPKHDNDLVNKEFVEKITSKRHTHRFEDIEGGYEVIDQVFKSRFKPGVIEVPYSTSQIYFKINTDEEYLFVEDDKLVFKPTGLAKEQHRHLITDIDGLEQALLQFMDKIKTGGLISTTLLEDGTIWFSVKTDNKTIEISENGIQIKKIYDYNLEKEIITDENIKNNAGIKWSKIDKSGSLLKNIGDIPEYSKGFLFYNGTAFEWIEDKKVKNYHANQVKLTFDFERSVFKIIIPEYKLVINGVHIGDWTEIEYWNRDVEEININNNILTINGDETGVIILEVKI